MDNPLLIDTFCTEGELCHNIFEAYELKHFVCFRNYLHKNINLKDYSILIIDRHTFSPTKILIDENDKIISPYIPNKVYLADFILEDYNDDKYIYLDYLIKFKPKSKNQSIPYIFYLLESYCYIDGESAILKSILNIINYALDSGWPTSNNSLTISPLNYFLILVDYRCMSHGNNEIIEIYKEIIPKLIEGGVNVPTEREIRRVFKNNNLSDELSNIIFKEFYESVNTINLIKEPSETE